MKYLFDLKRDKYGLKSIFHALMGIVILLVGSLFASLPVDLFYRITRFEAHTSVIVIRSVLNIAVLLVIVCLYIRRVLNLSLQEFRISKPSNILLWFFCAILLPLAVSAFFILATPGIFSSSQLEASENVVIVLRAVFRSCLVAGITEELVFRGLIMHILEIRWGKTVAVIVPSVLFGLLHILNMDSPSISDALILVIAGTAVGIMFSMIAIQSGSIWASATVHGIWNLIIIGGVLEISTEPSSAMFTYHLTSESKLLTGGAFGIEASVPAIAGYVLVGILAFVLLYRKSCYRFHGGKHV